METEETKILRMVMIDGRTYLDQGDICSFLMGIKDACQSLDAKSQFKELLKTLGCANNK